MPIAKEARLFLLVVGIIISLAHYKFGLELLWPAWILFAILLFIFRDYKRRVPAIPLGVVSSIDGKIVAIEESQNPYLDCSAQVIHIRQSLFGEFNVHSPIEGKVQNLWVNSPSEPKSQQLAIWIQTDEQDDIVMAADLNSPLRHATCSISAGEKLGQGQRCGFLAIACEVVIYIPITAHVAIKVGQSVRAGSDLLAEFVRDTSA